MPQGCLALGDLHMVAKLGGYAWYSLALQQPVGVHPQNKREELNRKPKELRYTRETAYYR